MDFRTLVNALSKSNDNFEYVILRFYDYAALLFAIYFVTKLSSENSDETGFRVIAMVFASTVFGVLSTFYRRLILKKND